MGFGILILIAFIAFTFITIVRKWYDYAILFTIAIGFAINANLFTGMNNEIEAFGLIFSVSPIFYVCFVFATLICLREYGPKKAKIMTSSTIAAILVSGVIEYLAKLSHNGYNMIDLKTLASYTYSALGSFIAVWTIVFIYIKMRKKNVYLIFLTCFIIAVVIHAVVYYSLYALTIGINNLGLILLGSLILVSISIVLAFTSYFINTHWWIPNSLKFRYKKKKD